MSRYQHWYLECLDLNLDSRKPVLFGTALFSTKLQCTCTSLGVLLSSRYLTPSAANSARVARVARLTASGWSVTPWGCCLLWAGDRLLHLYHSKHPEGVVKCPLLPGLDEGVTVGRQGLAREPQGGNWLLQLFSQPPASVLSNHCIVFFS